MHSRLETEMHLGLPMRFVTKMQKAIGKLKGSLMLKGIQIRMVIVTQKAIAMNCLKQRDSYLPKKMRLEIEMHLGLPMRSGSPMHSDWQKHLGTVNQKVTAMHLGFGLQTDFVS